MPYAHGLKDFSAEVKFQVGKRVMIDISEVPKQERNCESGIIFSISTRFALAPEQRQVSYGVWLDAPYIKKGSRYWTGLGERFNVFESQLTLEGKKEEQNA